MTSEPIETPSHDATSREGRIRIAEAVTVAACVAVVLLFGWGAIASQRALSDVEHAQRVLTIVDNARDQQVAVRLHSRGVLLSGSKAEARAAIASMRQRDSAMRELSAMRAKPNALHARVTEIATLMHRTDSIGYTARTTAETVGADSAWAEMQASGIVPLLNEVEVRLSALHRDEQQRLRAMVERQHGALRLTLMSAIVGAILAGIIGLMTLRLRRQNTQQILADAAMFRRLAEDNPDGVLVHVGYDVVYANSAVERMLRAEGRSIVGRRIPELVHPEDRMEIDRRTAQVSQSQAPTPPRIVRFLRDDGGVCEAEARGAPITYDGVPAIQVVLRDLSTRRDAELALQQSEQRFRAVLEAMEEGVVLHGPDLSIGLSNPAAQRILGLTADQIAGRTPHHPEWRTIDADGTPFAPDRHYASVALRTGLPASGIMGVDRPGADRVWITVTAVPLIRPGEPHPIGVVATFADITARRGLEEQLRQAQKMEVMGRMASGVAHDFNNLLTIIRSSTELLRADARRKGLTFDTLSDIESATDRAAALTTHLLTFSRRQHAAPALVQPARLVTDALPILRRLAGDAVTVEHLDQVGDAVWVWADPVRLEQVLVNLVSNAKDAMPSGGTVRIHTGSVALQESVTHRFGVITAGRYMTLTVEDTGTGMTGSVLDHLFDPFYTTKPQGRGTGLGLSIVYGIVHEALGTITVQSEPGRGSRLTVYWPRAETPATPLPAPARSPLATPPATHATSAAVDASFPAAAPAPRETGDLILLVDDEEHVRRVVAKQLEASGYAVITAESGRSALAMLRNAAFDIRLVVSDVRMPEMTGIELVTAMHAEQIDRPVLLVSGQMDTQLPRSWPVGAIVRFLPKPLSGVALRRAIGEMLTLTVRTDGAAR